MKVLLADDHEVIRLGLRSLLRQREGIDVVGEAASAAEAIALSQALSPDLVLMDIRMPGRNGIDACAEIRRVCPSIRVLILTAFAEDDLLFDSIAAGASGYVLKQTASTDLLEAMAAVGRGEYVIDPSLSSQLFSRVRLSVERDRRDAFAALTDQELRVLALLTEGKTNREVGSELSLGEKTVRNYVSSILAKLQLVSRTEAATYAVRHHVEDVVQR